MKNILLDLNIDGDCTNLCALAILNILANRGDARMLATTACFDSPLATGCVKAINHYYGHDDVPVGILHRQEATHPTPFMKPVNETFRPDRPNGEEAPDTVDVMRQALAAEEDGSVILVVVGCFASFAALLQSAPDGISPLSGQELSERKISRVVAMAGHFPIFDGERVFPENNVKVQIPAAQYVVEHWKGELVFTDWGLGFRTRSLKEFRTHGSPDHPLRMMYRINDGDDDAQGDLQFPDGNPSWDQTAVLEAVYPGRYFTYHEFGRVSVDDAGYTIWREDREGKHTYLLPRSPLNDVAAVVNDLVFPEWRTCR